jgi:predicted dehydrogenase
MAAHGEEYNAVIIVTPHTSHVSIGHTFAQLGKHILMDKPAGISAGEVEGLVRYCKDCGLAFSMIFNNRQLPVFRAMKEKLAAGVLGTLHRAVWVCNDWYRSPAYHASAGWRSSWNGECGGMMVNQNPHYLDMWNWYFGLPEKVYASMEFGRYNDFLVDDAVDIQFFYESGFHGTFISATGEAPGINRLEVWGSKGRLTMEGNKITFAENQPPIEEFAKTNTEKFARIPYVVTEEVFDQQVNPYDIIMENFAAHILCGTPLLTTGQDGLREVQLANALYVSGWEEKKVTVPVAEERYLDGLTLRRNAERKRNE